MSTKLNYEKLKKLLQEKQTIVEAWVECNPFGKGKRTKLKFGLDKYGDLSTYCFGQDDIEGVYYGWDVKWFNLYKGTFELVDELPVKPEVYKAHDWVIVDEQYMLKNCEYGDYADKLEAEDKSLKIKSQIGRPLKIHYAIDEYDETGGVSYQVIYNTLPKEEEHKYTYVETIRVPYYAVKRVNPPEAETITINNKTYLKSKYDLAIAELEEIK